MRWLRSGGGASSNSSTGFSTSYRPSNTMTNTYSLIALTRKYLLGTFHDPAGGGILNLLMPIHA
jgi:hypothetical protein